MRPTLWLKNDSGDIWDLRPRRLLQAAYASFFSTLDGTGFETKLTVARVKYDFVITEETPQQVPIKGKMYFRDPTQMRRFGEFMGDYAQSVQLFYDPEGKIDPRSQIDRPWYKVVKITKLSSGEQDKKTGFWICDMVFTPLSVMWRRGTTIASTTSLVVGDPHVYPFIYPYFYQSERKLYLNVLNDGERIGCRISITNNGKNALGALEWSVSSGDVRQYAKWLDGIGLAPGRTLLIDSNPGSQEASVKYGEGSDDAGDYQEANPQYINFVDLYPGNNQIVFNLGTVDDVTVTASYTEQVRAL